MNNRSASTQSRKKSLRNNKEVEVQNQISQMYKTSSTFKLPEMSQFETTDRTVGITSSKTIAFDKSKIEFTAVSNQKIRQMNFQSVTHGTNFYNGNKKTDLKKKPTGKTNQTVDENESSKESLEDQKEIDTAAQTQSVFRPAPSNTFLDIKKDTYKFRKAPENNVFINKLLTLNKDTGSANDLDQMLRKGI